MIVVTAIVVGYVLAGGAYANAYVNTMQAAIMAIVAAMIVGSGLGHLFDRVRSVRPRRVAVQDPLEVALRDQLR